MSISDQAKAIVDVLNTWAANEGGKAFVASDMSNLWQMAQEGPQNPRVLLCYNGEDIRGEFGVAAQTGMIDRHWIAAFTRGRGFNVERGDSLTETRQNARPFYDLIDEGRDLIRNLLLDEIADGPVDFKLVRPMQMGELIIDGYIVEFSVGTQLTALS